MLLVWQRKGKIKPYQWVHSKITSTTIFHSLSEQQYVSTACVLTTLTRVGGPREVTTKRSFTSSNSSPSILIGEIIIDYLKGVKAVYPGEWHMLASKLVPNWVLTFLMRLQSRSFPRDWRAGENEKLKVCKIQSFLMCLSSCFSKEVLAFEVEKAKAGAYISGIILRYVQKIIFMFEAQEPTEAYILSGS